MGHLNREERLWIDGEKSINAPALAFVQRLRRSQLRDVGDGRS
jgi:hypothetical protein